MWYFLVRQLDIPYEQYQALQRKATLTEVELFNDPYHNWYIFSTEKADYIRFMNGLDRDGIAYELYNDRPSRDDLLAKMR
jgi:hypothetical protein